MQGSKIKSGLTTSFGGFLKQQHLSIDSYPRIIVGFVEGVFVQVTVNVHYTQTFIHPPLYINVRTLYVCQTALA